MRAPDEVTQPLETASFSGLQGITRRYETMLRMALDGRQKDVCEACGISESRLSRAKTGEHGYGLTLAEFASVIAYFNTNGVLSLNESTDGMTLIDNHELNALVVLADLRLSDMKRMRDL